MKELVDHLEECDELYQLLVTLPEEEWTQKTPFKDWSINQVIQHLMFLDNIAIIAIENPNEFGLKLAEFSRSNITTTFLGKSLLQEWKNTYLELHEVFLRNIDAENIPWFGPSMNSKTLLVARQMEVWAHGQDIYDLLRLQRVNSDRIENICTLGMKTFSWSFKNRKLDIPKNKPRVELILPSGESKTYLESDKGSDEHIGSIRGAAVEFAQVVTQCRNIADTGLILEGNNAQQWMAIAQCFAGKAEKPPKKGERVFE